MYVLRRVEGNSFQCNKALKRSKTTYFTLTSTPGVGDQTLLLKMLSHRREFPSCPWKSISVIEQEGASTRHFAVVNNQTSQKLGKTLKESSM